VITLVWILVVLYRVEAFIIQNAKLEEMVRRMNQAKVGDAGERAAAAFGLSTKNIHIVQAEWVTSPLTYGVIKKTILLPLGFEEKYSDEQLYLLLLHEMAHIKNGDMAKFYFIRYLSALFLIPPGFVKAFKRDTEILCDNRVLGVTNTSAKIYGGLLVDVCSKEASQIKGFAFSDSYKALKSRILAIQYLRPVRHRLSVFAIAMGLCCVWAFVWAWNVPSQWYRDSHPGNLEIEAGFVFEDGFYNIEDAALDLSSVFYYSDDSYRLYYNYDALEAVYNELVAQGKAPQALRVEIGGYQAGLTVQDTVYTTIALPLQENSRDNASLRMVFPNNSEWEYIIRYIAHWL
jgi:hypothetical protein